MSEPHINETELLKKIFDLFEYRLFPELLTLAGVQDMEAHRFLEALARLQASIYHLDAHLESNWETRHEALAYHWAQIVSRLSDMGVDRARAGEYLNHIRKYEKHELELRQGKSPLRFDMEYFYFYKSCDVKLLRRLIYEHFQLTPAAGRLADWRYYDLVTEVNDDVEDLFEDLTFINGNRFLISLIIKGKQDTRNTFVTFLSEVDAKSHERAKTAGPYYREVIMPLTARRITETSSLLEQRLNEITAKQLSESRLFKHQTITP